MNQNKPEPRQTHKTTIDLPIETYEKINRLANDRQTSRKAVIFEIIAEWFGNPGGDLKNQSGKIAVLESTIETLKQQLNEKQATIESTTKSLELANDGIVQAQNLNAIDKLQLGVYQTALANATKTKPFVQRLISAFVPEQPPNIGSINSEDYSSSGSSYSSSA